MKLKIRILKDYKDRLNLFLHTICCFMVVFMFSDLLFAHGSTSTVVDAKKQNPATINQFLKKQVENNVAVEFFIKPLSRDYTDFEKEMEKLKFEFSTKNDQNLSYGDSTTVESKVEKDVSDVNNKYVVKAKQDVALLFKVTDATMNWPIQGQGFVPDSPIRAVNGRGNFIQSRKQVYIRAKQYGGHFPIDEYTYLYVLNGVDGTVSVMDTSSLYSGAPIEMISLSEGNKSKGIDIDMEWLGRYAYVTLDSDEVAVIDCMRIKRVKTLKVGKDPHHIVVQPDGKFAWVCNDGDATVTVIDTENQNIVATLPVGKGHHEIAFTLDSGYACVTNRDDDSVTVIDVFKLLVLNEIKVGKQPHGLGFSELSQYMYVANEGDGTVSVVAIKLGEVVKTITVGKGCVKVRFGPNARYGFVPNKLDNTCSMIDVTKDFVFKTFDTGKGPEDITFSPDWVFIRNTKSADMTAMCMNQYGMLTNVPIGYKKPIDSDLPMGHLNVVPQGDGHSVLVPSPGGRAVYRYAPGEAAAGGRVPTEIYNTQANGSSKLVVYYRGLKEISNGVYLRIVRFLTPGRYEVGFYIDNPELTGCFEVFVTK